MNTLKSTLTKQLQDSAVYKKIVEFSGLYSRIQQLEEVVRNNHALIEIQQRRIAVLDDAREGEVVLNKASTISKKEAKLIKKLLQVRRTTVFDLESIKEHDRYLEINDTVARIFFTAKLPNILSISPIHKLLHLGLPLTLSYNIQGTSRSYILQTAKNRQAVLIAEQSERLKKGRSRDNDIDREIEEVTSLIDDITYDREQTFMVSLYAMLRATNHDSLVQDSRYLQQEMEDAGVTLNTYSFGQATALLSILPLATDTVKKNHILHTQGVANLLPFLTRTFNDENGILLGSSRANNSLVLLDLFKARNALVNVFGVSGSGKSFLVKLIISRLLIRGVQNIIIDPEGEYVELTNHFNGQVVSFSQDEGINLFQVPPTIDVTDHIATLKTFFSLFISSQRSDLSLLDSLLVNFYESQSTKNLTAFVDLCKKQRASFVTDLEVLLTGSLKGYFDGDREISFDNDIICFDLSKLANDDRKIPTMFLVGSLINALIEDRQKRRMIYIDEAHKLLRNKGTIEFYINLVKTARKRKAGVVSITQNPEDFREESGAKTILTQAETSIILKQAYSSMNFIQEKRIFPITEQESREIISLAIGQALLIREKEHVMLEVFPLESEEDYIYT